MVQWEIEILVRLVPMKWRCDGLIGMVRWTRRFDLWLLPGFTVLSSWVKRLVPQCVLPCFILFRTNLIFF